MQEPFAASVPPEKLIDNEPATTPVAVPPQVLLMLGTPAMASPAGKLSVKLIPVSAVAEFGFWIVKLKPTVPPKAAAVDPKAFAIVGGATVAALVLVSEKPPGLVVSEPADVVTV